MHRELTAVLNAFIDGKTSEARRQGLPVDIPTVLGKFLASGGKRIRPTMCVLGWHAAGGTDSVQPAVRAGASLEMFHAFCLIHDDVMDHSATRRGQPTVHRALATHHHHGRTVAAADALGESAAILAGDLALIWSDELLYGPDSELSPAHRECVRPLVNVMRSEVMYGQYLDLTATGRPTTDVERALAIARYKTAKYTIERPLHIGAALAGAGREMLDALSAYALPLGEAFQLRDDILGTFGDPAETGKPRLDDLRQGKHTVLLALALQRADSAECEALHALVGDPRLDEDAAARIRHIITATGARAAVEDMIRVRREQAGRALLTVPVAPAVEQSLQEFADAVTGRTT